VLKVTLIPHKHDDNVGVSVVAKFFQPSCDIIISLVFADIVDEQSANSAAVICRSNSPVPLLACCIPNLGFDRLGINLKGPGSEFDTNGGLGIQVELISGKTAQQIRLSNTGITDKNNCIGKEVAFLVTISL
jgi:hypothetical protein